MTVSGTLTPHEVTPPHLRLATLDDYDSIVRLEFAHGLLSLTRTDWTHLVTGNPVTRSMPNRWPIGWVLEQGDGRVVGALHNLITGFIFHGQSLIAATGRGWVVEPEYRAFALWLMDEYFNQEGIDLFLNTTVNANAVETFTAFGSKRVPVGDWSRAAFTITNYRGFAKSGLNVKGIPASGLLSLPLALGLGSIDAVRGKRFQSADPALTLDFVASFDEAFDLFWKELLAQKPDTLLGIRDSATLAWHFRGPLHAGNAWILIGTRQNQIRAYAIFKRQDHPPSGLSRMRLVDFQSLDPSDVVLPQFIRLAYDRCKHERIHVLEQVGCGLPRMTSFDRIAVYRRSLPAWPYYYNATEDQLDRSLSNPAAWDPSAYDGDTSI